MKAPRHGAPSLALATELALPLDVVTQKLNILGQSGGGKTYTAMKLAELMLEALAQVIVLDLVGVWRGLRSSADGRHPGFPITIIGGEHGDLPLTPGAGALVADLVVDRGLSVVLDLSSLLHEEMLQFATDFIDRLFHRKKTRKSPVHVFFEEAQELIPETPTTKAEARCRSVCIRMCKIGRNYGIGYSVITQEPQAASKRVLNQAGTIIAVRTIGEHERKAIAGTARSKATSKEQLNLLDVLPELETGEAIVWSPAWLKFAGKVHIRPKVTFDSSKTPEVGEAPPQPQVLAPVELAQLRTAMAAAVAEAEQNDPSSLRRRVQQLEAQLASRPSAEPERIEIPVPFVDPALPPRLRALHRGLAELVAGVDALTTELAAAVDGQAARPASPDVWTARAPFQALRRTATSVERVQRPPNPSALPTPAVRGAGGGVELKKGAREMLRELVALHPRVMTRRELATRAVISHSSSTFSEYLGALKSHGYAELDENGDVRASAVGVKVGGQATPKTSEAIVAMWGSKTFKRGARVMLELLLQDPQRRWARDDIATAASISATSSTFSEYLGALRSSGCADEQPRGQFVAGHALFMGGAT